MAADETNGNEIRCVVKVFAPPLSECAGENTWENAAHGMEARMRSRFGTIVRFQTVHLFSPEFFDHPEVMQLVQSGGKLSERTIRQALEWALENHGLRPDEDWADS